MKKIFCLLAALLFLGKLQAQDIEILDISKGFKEIDFTKPSFNLKPDPIPKEGDTYKTTHYLVVYCSDGEGESGLIHQYINMTNGVVGIPKELLRQWETGTESMEGVENLHYWAILPSMNQRMYVDTPDMGKIVMGMTAGDGTQTTTMARFDAYMQGEIFWTSAKKIKTKTFPKGAFITSANNEAPAVTADVYEFNSEEGKVHIYLKDLGEASGQFAPIKSTFAATGMGGMGWVYNKRNNHVYLVMQILKADNLQYGCRIVEFYPKKHTFSGAGYKPMGDIMLQKVQESHKENNTAIDENLSQELENEEDAQLKALLKEKAQIEKELQKKTMENMSNAALLNDASEITRSTFEMAMNGDFMYKTLDIDLRIEARKIQIELNREGITADERRELNKKLNCNTKQRQLWANYRDEAKKLKEKVKGLEQYEQMEKFTALMSDYQQRSLSLCQ
ncbi:hypothetical protein [Emticicia sp. W12TSBA100-4]|uniref:hypothetical protein n=1 Tax=Emticicia sp. W12TSBA100-4 TaxID=3160965 RepID=UPI003305A94A